MSRSIFGAAVGGAFLLAAGWAAGVALAQDATSPAAGADLKPASAFESIGDERERSLAMFEEAGKCYSIHAA